MAHIQTARATATGEVIGDGIKFDLDLHISEITNISFVTFYYLD